MSSSEIMTPQEAAVCEGLWREAAMSAAEFSQKLLDAGLHKQWANRGTETYQRVKQVITGTEWNNLFWLRVHKDAQPEFQELAKCMLQALDKSNPVQLLNGEWHLPYVNSTRRPDGELIYLDTDGGTLSLDEARRISTSCCAQASYRKNDDSVAKADKVYSMLNIGSTEDPSHASPTEHQATPMKSFQQVSSLHWEEGVTHQDRSGKYWSGNFQGWIQHRKLLAGECVHG
jgi:hypothetical protein